MNKKIRILSLIVIFVLLLFPFNKAAAATYKTMMVTMSNFTSAESTTCKGKGTDCKVKISSARSHRLAPTYTFNFHEIKDGSYYYIGYCLHAEASVANGASVTQVTKFDKLKMSDNTSNLNNAQQTLLKNILASGFQITRSKDLFNGIILTKTSGDYGTCKNKTACKKMLATQILVWEVMTGARTNYDEKPNEAPTSNNTHDYVKTDSELYTIYKKILSDAKNLTQDDNIPAALSASSTSDTKTKTYALHWNGSKYVSQTIDVGSYELDKTTLPSGVTSSGTSGKIKFTSNKEFTTKKLTFNFTKGSTGKNAATFRWYTFGKGNTYQDVVMGDYKKTVSAKMKIKVESGKIRISKKDENGNNLKGSKFVIYTCSGSVCKTKFKTIDLTTTPTSGDISLKKSGKYLFVEKETPKGHQSIGQFTVKISIDDDGKVTISGVSNKSVTVSGNKTSLAIIRVPNTSKKIYLKKIDGITNTAINGAKFQILNSKNKVVKFSTMSDGSYKYDTSGKVSSLVKTNKDTYAISALPEGTYYVLEKAVPSPYSLAGTDPERTTAFKIDSKGTLSVYNYSKKKWEVSKTATITVKNYKTSFRVVKTGIGSKTLAGVQYTLYKSDKKTTIKLKKDTKNPGVYSYVSGASTTQLTTNSSGAIRINYLPDGTYYLKETKTYKNYIINKDTEWKQVVVDVQRNTVKVKINGGEINGTSKNTGTYTWKNDNVIKIKKVDGSSTTTEVKGATFQILNSKSQAMHFKKTSGKDEKGTTVDYYKYTGNSSDDTNLVYSDKSVYVIGGLPAGEYTLYETAVPYPYSLASDKEDRKTKFKISSTGGLSVMNTKGKYVTMSTATITVKNYKTTFKVVKRGKKNVTLSGVEFKLYTSNKSTEVKLEQEEYPGVYRYSPSGKSLTITTNSSGAFRVNRLPAGTYYLKETKAQDGYELDDELRKIVVAVNKGSVKITISKADGSEAKTYDGSKQDTTIYYNWPNTANEFCFYKMDDEGKYLSGGKFHIETKVGNEFKCTIITPSDGAYNLGETTSGTSCTNGTYQFSAKGETETCFELAKINTEYRIVEDDAPAGYKLSDSSSKVTFKTNSKGATSTAPTIINTKKKIKLEKVDGTSGDEIPGATFQIFNSKNEQVKFTKQDSYYEYAATGTITDLKEDSNVYTIAGLLEGEYYAFETAVPSPYTLAGTETERKTKFKIDSEGTLYVWDYDKKNYVKESSATITVKNYTTTFEIKKVGTKDVGLSGVEFELYDENQTTRTKVVNSDEDGVYDYSSSATDVATLVTNDAGSIKVNYLPAGTYYLKESKALDGYVIDEKMIWRKVEISVTRGKVEVKISTVPPAEVNTVTIDATNPSAVDAYKWSNTPGGFCFYKMDEDGNYLNGGKFKIQTYNDTGKYVDQALEYISGDETYTFDSTGESDIYTFSPISNGETCFTNVKVKGKYRIVEIEAPEGYQLSSTSDTYVEFTIDSEGYVSGDTTIINNKIVKGEGSESQAELIINIQTGQTIVRYGLIIASIVAAIIGLLFLNKKLNKNK